MPLYTHAADDTRTVRQVGNIKDAIKNITLRATPILGRFMERKIDDIRPTGLEDVLRGLNNANRHAQDAAAPAALDTLRTETLNWTQIYMDTARTTDTQNAVRQYGMASEFTYQRGKKLIDNRMAIEGIIVSDQAAQEPTNVASNIGRMAGLGSLIITHVGTVFNQATYDALLTNCLQDGGVPFIAYMDTARKRAVNGWTTAPTRFSSEVQRLEKEVLVYHSDFGPDMQMRWHHMMPNSVELCSPIFYGLQPNLWEHTPLIRTTWKPLADDGSGPRGVWKTETSLLALAEKGNFQFRTCASPSPSPAPE
jgi:hypothetical protein